jgi:hypothetical protein
MTNGVQEPSSSEEETPFSLLRSRLKKSQKRSTFEKTPHKFVPEGIIDKFITEKAIQELLCIQDPKSELVQFVKLRAKKVFAIAVYSNLEKTLTKVMRWFKKTDLDDDDLPIAPHSDGSKTTWREDFLDNQWIFLAPVFFTTQYSHDLNEAHILPFVAKSVDFGRGSFGVVSQYDIHMNHLKPVSFRQKVRSSRSTLLIPCSASQPINLLQ